MTPPHQVPLLRNSARQPVAPISARPVERPNIDAEGNAWGEIPGSRDVGPEAPSPEAARGGSGGGGGGGGGGGAVWRLFESDEISVCAAPVEHTVPCVGYVVAEKDKEGRLLVDKALPMLEANRKAIFDLWGVRDPRALLKKVKALGMDGELALPDGQVLRGSELMGESRRGRKLVVLGDCCDASPCAQLARGADLLIHEATNAYLPTFGDRGGGEKLQRETYRRGHSTPQMAGEFARRVGARALLLTHFSQRYHPAAFKVMQTIAQQAADAARLPTNCVAAAYDTLSVPLWAPDRHKPPLPAEALAPAPRHAVQQAYEPVDDTKLGEWMAEYGDDSSMDS